MNSTSDIIEVGEGHEEGNTNGGSADTFQSNLGTRMMGEDMAIHGDTVTDEIGTESTCLRQQGDNIHNNVGTIENQNLESEAKYGHSSPLRVQSLHSATSSSFDTDTENKMESNISTPSVVAGQPLSPLKGQTTSPTPCQSQPPSSDQVVAHSFV